jgi:hypothetical protein
MPLNRRISGSRIFAELWTETSTAKAPSPCRHSHGTLADTAPRGDCSAYRLRSSTARYARSSEQAAWRQTRRDDPKAIAHAVHKFLDFMAERQPWVTHYVDGRKLEASPLRPGLSTCVQERPCRIFAVWSRTATEWSE